MVNTILPPAPAVEEDPNVLIAEDDGMEVDAEVVGKMNSRNALFRFPLSLSW